jgi:hypothetical protein
MSVVLFPKGRFMNGETMEKTYLRSFVKEVSEDAPLSRDLFDCYQ